MRTDRLLQWDVENFIRTFYLDEHIACCNETLENFIRTLC